MDFCRVRNYFLQLEGSQRNCVIELHWNESREIEERLGRLYRHRVIDYEFLITVTIATLYKEGATRKLDVFGHNLVRM